MEKFNKVGNYNIPLDYAKNEFRKKDPILMAKLSNSYYDKNTSIFHVKCMDFTLYVEYPSGDIYKENGEKLDKITLEILVIRFLVNANPIPPTNKYITFKEIDGGHVYYPAFLRTSINRLTKEFGGNVEKFKSVMKNIGASKINMGDSAYKIRFLNDTYIIYILWSGDDEIESASNILFDSNIKHYFNAEDIAVIGDIPFIRIYEELDNL
ncbi:DUF3786 domain-containing protein [Romboutsia sp. MSSM.1001216sp_RTP31141st1_G3_RTP31141_220114]|uniref:DUF3786 domain-containing protein n=1 Tax=unclassified Romboutsia TaxID=2626894 RepID=UPI0031B5991E